jgi:hypothetical protein
MVYKKGANSMDEYNKHHQKEEYAAEISPSYRQDVRKEEGQHLSPFLVGLTVLAIVLIVFLISYFQ